MLTSTVSRERCEFRAVIPFETLICAIERSKGGDNCDPEDTYVNKSHSGNPTRVTGLTLSGAARSLALVVLKAADAAENQVDDFGSELGGEISLRGLRKEAASVFGIGRWMEMELKPDIKDKIARNLCKQIGLHITSYLGNYEGEIEVFETKEKGRMEVFRKALHSKFGMEAAPTACMIAGAPLVLFVDEEMPKTSKIQGEGIDWSLDDTIETEWKALCTGIAKFRKIKVGGLENLRTAVSTALKSAVKAGLSPTLVLLRATPHSALLRGVEVVRAVSDAYGGRVHVEGSAMAILAPSIVTSSCRINLQKWAHSLLLDPARWFSVMRAGVVLCCRKIPETPAALLEGRLGSHENGELHERDVSPLMVLYHILIRAGSSYAREVVSSSIVNLDLLADRLALKAHLIETRTIPGFGMLISASSLLPPELRSLITKALRIQILQLTIADSFRVSVISYNLIPYIAFSPALNLKYGTRAELATNDQVEELSQLIISTVTRCTIAASARVAFIVRVKGCVELEQTKISEGGPYAALFFCGLRVVPLGCTSWRADAEERQLVEKATVALAAELAAISEKPCLTFLYDEGEYTCCVHVGPKWSQEDGEYAPGDDVVFKETATKSADIVIKSVRRVLSAIQNPGIVESSLPLTRDEQNVDPETFKRNQVSDQAFSFAKDSSQVQQIRAKDRDEDTISRDAEGSEPNGAIGPMAVRVQSHTMEHATDENNPEKKDKEVEKGFWERIFGSSSSADAKVANRDISPTNDDGMFNSSSDEEDLEEDFFRP